MALALGEILVMFRLSREAHTSSHNDQLNSESATRRQRYATCAKPRRDPTAGASFYLMPRSLGAACLCSPSATQCLGANFRVLAWRERPRRRESPGLSYIWPLARVAEASRERTEASRLPDPQCFPHLETRARLCWHVRSVVSSIMNVVD